MLWLYLSNITYVARLTGIPRTEYEVFIYALQKRVQGEQIKFCTYRADKGFIELNETEIDQIVNRFKIIEKMGLHNFYISQRKKGIKKFFLLKWKTSLNKKIHLLKTYFNFISHPFKTGDTIISLGLNIKSKDIKEMNQIKKNILLNIRVFCHDIIPLTHPDLVKKESHLKFNQYFRQLIKVANFYYCNSNYTKTELIKYFQTKNLQKPAIKVISLGSDIKSMVDNNYINPKIKKIAKENYILFVSSIEIRKNHKILYDAYMILLNKKISPLPKLLFIGQRGWMVDELLKNVQQNSIIKDSIIIFDCVSDLELSYLYQNCLFTVFPSLIEGFGLPIVESLRYGKFCLAANTGALPEVGLNFVDYLNPNDSYAWADKLEFLFKNSKYIIDREKNIRDNYRFISWKHTAESILKIEDN